MPSISLRTFVVFLVAGLCAGCGGAPDLDGFEMHVSDHYLVYAPSEGALQDARDELDHAVDRFSHYFGRPPGTLAVVTVDDPMQLASLDVSRVKPLADQFLPFVTSGYLRGRSGSGASTISASSVLPIDAGPVFVDRDGEPRVVAVIDFPSAPDVDVREGDVLVAMNGTDVATASEASEVYRSVAVGETVSLTLRREAETVEVAYEKVNDGPSARVMGTGASADTASSSGADASGGDTTASSATGRDLSQDRPLSHEACHKYVSAYANAALGGAPVGGGDAYGHVRLPDWFDEMAATLCEFPSLKQERMTYLRDHLDDALPLDTLFTMRHPLNGRVMQLANADTASTTSVRVITGAAAQELLQGTNATLFYAQSLSLGEFLFDRGGAEAIRGLAWELMQDATMDEALSRVEGLPNDVDVLESAWRASLTSDDATASAQ